MLREGLKLYRPSLRRWALAFAIMWLVGAGIMAPLSITLLDQIYDDAQLTYSQEIPSLLDQDRKAIKLERLSSFLVSIGATRDLQAERHTFLQMQALAQGFDLDNDARLNDIVARTVSDARKIMAQHTALRRLAAGPKLTDGPDDKTKPLDLEQAARKVTEDGVQALNAATDDLTTGAALSADTLANRIQQNASRIKRGCFVVLGVFFASGVFLLLIFYHHVLTPIRVAVRGLEAIRESDGAPIALPRSRFFELDTIGRAVEQYARFASDLRAANHALSTLSSQDGLTGLANRRSFDTALREACRRTEMGVGAFALLLIDIDHFKRLNDSFGHLVGDECLRQVASILQDVCSGRGNLVSRYGGEEFAIIMMDSSLDEACKAAEHLRASVEQAEVCVTDARHPICMTVSVGVVAMASGSIDPPDHVIAEADQHLYRAKHEGRNRIVTASSGSPQGPRLRLQHETEPLSAA